MQQQGVHNKTTAKKNIIFPSGNTDSGHNSSSRKHSMDNRYTEQKPINSTT
ncbi:not available (plasmid) [Salmonella enterica]|nr:not available [Salmonella enterica]WIW81026.1 hypothetical protein [Salmonella sp.]